MLCLCWYVAQTHDSCCVNFVLQNANKNKGVKKIFEIGPGNVLSGLVKRTTKNIECFSIQKPEDMDNLK